MEMRCGEDEVIAHLVRPTGLSGLITNSLSRVQVESDELSRVNLRSGMFPPGQRLRQDHR